MQFATREIGEVLIVEVDTPWLDGPRAASLREGLVPLIGCRPAILVDLSPVRYLDLFAFDALLAALETSDGAIAVCCPDPGVASLFDTTLPHGTIPIFPDIDAALLEIAPAGDDKALLKS